MSEEKLKTKYWKAVAARVAKAVVGLPLVYLGVALLALHFFLQLNSNVLLLVAIAVEVVGIVAHYWRVKH